MPIEYSENNKKADMLNIYLECKIADYKQVLEGQDMRL